MCNTFAFPGITGCTNTPQCYVILTWPVLFIITSPFTYTKHKSPTINTNVTLKKFNFLVHDNVQTLLECQDPVDVQGKDTAIQKHYYPKTLLSKDTAILRH
jgi:hypothetical protein